MEPVHIFGWKVSRGPRLLCWIDYNSQRSFEEWFWRAKQDRGLERVFRNC